MEGTMLENRCTLDEFALESGRGEGVCIEGLASGATVSVNTRHSCYEVSILDGRRHLVLIHGGVFAAPTVVRLSGATFGGSALKLGWILVGFRMEFGLGSRRIVSSTVLSVREGAAPQESATPSADPYVDCAA
jgi:hypothetical protein